MKKLIYLLFTLSIWSCNPRESNSIYKDCNKTFVEKLLNTKIDSSIIINSPDESLLINPSQLRFFVNYFDSCGSKYVCCFTDSFKINYILTSDKKFNLDNISVLSSYSDIPKSNISSEYDINGFGHYVVLKNNWKVVFRDSTLSENYKSASSKISSFILESD